MNLASSYKFGGQHLGPRLQVVQLSGVDASQSMETLGFAVPVGDNTNSSSSAREIISGFR